MTPQSRQFWGLKFVAFWWLIKSIELNMLVKEQQTIFTKEYVIVKENVKYVSISSELLNFCQFCQ